MRPQQKPSAQVDPPQPQEAVQEPDPAELQQQCKDARAAAIKQLAAVGGEAESRARAAAAELERAAAAPQGRSSFAPEAASTEPKPQMSPQTEGGASDGRVSTEADVPAQPDASFSTVLQQTSIATVEAEQAEQRLSMRSGDGVALASTSASAVTAESLAARPRTLNPSELQLLQKETGSPTGSSGWGASVGSFLWGSASKSTSSDSTPTSSQDPQQAGGKAQSPRQEPARGAAEAETEAVTLRAELVRLRQGYAEAQEQRAAQMERARAAEHDARVKKAQGEAELTVRHRSPLASPRPGLDLAMDLALDLPPALPAPLCTGAPRQGGLPQRGGWEACGRSVCSGCARRRCRADAEA